MCVVAIPWKTEAQYSLNSPVEVQKFLQNLLGKEDHIDIYEDDKIRQSNEWPLL